jgi:hypothetical protein
MSDGGRRRASLGVEVWKSSQNWSAQPRTFGVCSIGWLGRRLLLLNVFRWTAQARRTALPRQLRVKRPVVCTLLGPGVHRQFEPGGLVERGRGNGHEWPLVRGPKQAGTAFTAEAAPVVLRGLEPSQSALGRDHEMLFPGCRDSEKTSRKATAILAMARDNGWTEWANDRVPDRAAETAP